MSDIVTAVLFGGAVLGLLATLTIVTYEILCIVIEMLSRPFK